MSVIHILRGGDRLTDITGYVVRIEEARPLYQLLHSINQRKTGKKRNTYCSLKMR